MQKQVLFSILLIFFLNTYGEELKIITSGGLQGVAAGDGEVLIPPIYEALGWSDGSSNIVDGAIGFRESERWGLLNIKNKKATIPKYIVLKPFQGTLFEAGVKGKLTNHIFHGLIDKGSRTHLDFKYFSLESVGDGWVIVSEYADGNLKYGLYTDNNELVIPIEYDGISRIGQIIIATNNLSKKKLFTLTGEELISDWVDRITPYQSGFMVFKAGRVGFLTSEGKLVHDFKYKTIRDGRPVPFSGWEVVSLSDQKSVQMPCDSIKSLAEGNLMIAHVNSVEYILKASDVLFANQDQRLKYIGKGFLVTQSLGLENWAIFKTDGSPIAVGFDSVAVDSSYFFANTSAGWQIYNFFGRKINEYPFQAVAFSQDRVLPAMRNGYWGLIDFQGDRLVDFTLDRIVKTSNSGQFLANYLNKWGVIDVNNRWVILPEYDSIYTFKKLYVAKKGDAHHILDYRGALKNKITYPITPKAFLELSDQNLKGAITETGFLIHPVYDAVRLIDDYYELRSGEFITLLDQNGREIIKLTDGIQEVLAYSEGYFQMIKDGKHGFVDENGKLRIANRYDAALPFSEGIAPVKLLGRWGYIDRFENLVIQPFYDSSGNFLHDLAIVRSGGKYGLIDKNGNEIIQPAWKHIERLPTGNYLITDQTDKVGLANQDGRFLIRPAYDHLKDTDQALIIATRAGKKGVLDYSGLTRLPFNYAEVKISGEYMLLLKTTN